MALGRSLFSREVFTVERSHSPKYRPCRGAIEVKLIELEQQKRAELDEYRGRQTGNRVLITATEVQNLFRTLKHEVKDIYLCDCDFCHPLWGLDSEGRDYNAVLEKKLLGKYASIFALLIYKHYAGLIKDFVDRETCLEKGRPCLELEDFKKVLENAGGRLTSQHATLVPKLLYDAQFMFHTGTLEISKSDQPTELGYEVFPEVVKETKPVGEGAWSTVSSIRMIDDYLGASFNHLKKPKSKHLVLARKTLKNTSPRPKTTAVTLGQAEWKNLRTIREVFGSHDHIIECYGAFQQEHNFWFLFPLAEGSLNDYLLGKKVVSWGSKQLYDQLCGVIHALEVFHDDARGHIIYHRDITPSNLLIIQGTLKIADFGISKDRDIAVDGPSKGSIDEDRFSHLTYSAPPVWKPGQTKRHDDVYPVGAILSEVAVHNICNSAAVEDYRIDRNRERDPGRHYPLNTFHLSDGSLKPAVHTKHAALVRRCKNDPHYCRQRQFCKACFYSDEYFIYIETHLLHPEPNKRDSAQKARNFLVHWASCALENRPDADDEYVKVSIESSSVEGGVDGDDHFEMVDVFM